METATLPENSVHFESFELKLRTRELYRDGTRLKIRGHPIDVLAILLENPGELVTREELKKRLWPADTFVDFEQILNNSIGRLRDVLEDCAESPKFIETVPRLGYRFIAPVAKPAARIVVPQFTPNMETRGSVPIDSIPCTPVQHPQHWILWSALGFVAAVSAALVYWYVHTPLAAPFISHYEQLTLDGRRKIPRGTDGISVFMNLPGAPGGIIQVPVSGGKVTDFSIDLPGNADSPPMLANVSPDGSNLLVTNQFIAGRGFSLWVVGHLGRPVRYLTRAGATGWSPDGKTVVYATPHGDIFTISRDGGEPRLLHREDAPADQTIPARDMAWSPDGSTIRFTRFRGKIYEMSSTGENLHEWLPDWNGGIQKCCGHWTPDGEFYVFMAERTLAKDPQFRPLAQIWAVDERRGRIRARIAEPILLASGPLLWGNPIPSLDGKKIFARGVSLRAELERYDRVLKRLTPYLGGISADMPDFSRDGKYVAYVSFPDGILWRANRDGSQLVQLTQPPIYPRSPRWSPDGRELLFTANTEKGVDAIFVMPSQGGIPKRLMPDDPGPQSLADWSHDGAKVVYATDRSFSIMPWDVPSVETRILERATGKLISLPKRPGGFWAPLWSPDGRYISGLSTLSKELVIYDLKSGNWKLLAQTESLGFHRWSRDGRFLYYVSWAKGDPFGVYRVSTQGGKEELIMQFPERYRGTGWYDFWMSLDPDDAPLFVRDAGTDEIYALTLERK